MATTLKKLTGGPELQQFLNTLPAKIERNIMRSALRAGANVIKSAAQEEAPKDDGFLRESIRVSTRVRRGEVSAKVAARAYYAHMIEFGVAPHWISVNEKARPTRKTRRGPRAVSVRTLNRMAKRGSLVIGENFVGESVHHPGFTEKPFMRPAIDKNQDAVIRAVGEQIRKRLTKEGINAPDSLEVDDE